MGTMQIQDRTIEFKTIVAQAERRQASSKVGSQRRSLLTDSQKSAADTNGRPRRSEFARKVGTSRQPSFRKPYQPALTSPGRPPR